MPTGKREEASHKGCCVQLLRAPMHARREERGTGAARHQRERREEQGGAHRDGDGAGMGSRAGCQARVFMGHAPGPAVRVSRLCCCVSFLHRGATTPHNSSPVQGQEAVQCADGAVACAQSFCDASSIHTRCKRPRSVTTGTRGTTRDKTLFIRQTRGYLGPVSFRARGDTTTGISPDGLPDVAFCSAQCRGK